MEFNYTWSHVIERYNHYFKDKVPATTSELSDRQAEVATGRRNHWLGASVDEMLAYLSEGFEFPEMSYDLLPETVDSEQSKWRFTDDPDGAEYQYDLDYQGELDYYLKKMPTAPKPGIRLFIDMGFHSGIGAERIGRYGAWIGSLITSLEAHGYDLEIKLYSHNRKIITKPTRDDGKFYVEVSKFGELVFFKDWSAIFAPGGYRHLNHLVKMLPEEEGYKIHYGLGYPIVKGYAVKWDEESRELNITCGKGEFYPEEMTGELEQVKGLIT
jgi:hypothetical protein